MSDDLARRYQCAERHFCTLVIDDFRNDFPFNFEKPVFGADRQKCLALPFVKDFLQTPDNYDVYLLTREWADYEVGTILFYDHQEVFFVYRP